VLRQQALDSHIVPQDRKVGIQPQQPPSFRQSEEGVSDVLHLALPQRRDCVREFVLLCLEEFSLNKHEVV